MSNEVVKLVMYDKMALVRFVGSVDASCAVLGAGGGASGMDHEAPGQYGSECTREHENPPE